LVRKISKLKFLAVYLIAACCMAPVARAQGPIAAPQTSRAAFRATHYDVMATLTPAKQLLTVHAAVDFVANDTSSIVQVELHPNLAVTAVTNAAGVGMAFQRDARNPLILRVSLDAPVAASQSVTLNFDYAGPLSGEENSPIPGVTLASIGADGIYLLQPARWFPLTFFPTNRYTGVFKIQVPEAFSVAGTGKTGPPQIISDKATLPAIIKPGVAPPPPTAQKLFTFRDDTNEDSGTFAAAVYKVTPVEDGGMKIPVYTFPVSNQGAELFGNNAGKILSDFSDEFGPLANPSLTVAEMPDGSISGFAAPGLVLISQRQWSLRGNTRLLSHLIGAQWFGVSIMPASSADVWVTDGLSRYCEAIYARIDGGKEAEDRAVEDFAVGALMFEDAAPITQASQLKPFTSQYLSVVEDKGAVVLHMLNSVAGDEVFRAMLHDFYARYAGQNASVNDFQALAQQFMDAKAAGKPVATAPLKLKAGELPPAPPPATNSLGPFFAQWLSSTGVPEFHLDYKVYRNTKGFQIVGRVNQSLDTFSMPVEMEVQTEGNPEYKTIQVTGAETPFTIDSFGRPKPGGITIDPHDYILKASPRLRIRAIIARGEALAEQGRFVDAIVQYQKALDDQKNNALALFRMGEAFFYQKNYTVAASSFRSALGGDTDLSTKWVETWAHIDMGMIYDLTGQRERAVNEYRLATQTRDNTGGAQDVAKKYMAQPYKGD
jgi:hypothetical protein